jgi:hypothetical protein
MAGVLGDREELLARIVVRAQTEFEGYLRFDSDELAPGAGAILDLMLVALREGRHPSAEELVEYRAYGRDRAEMGIPLDEVLGVWRMSSREILADLATVAREEGLADHLVLTLSNELLDTFDIAIRAYTVGHQEVEMARAGREHQQRADFVRAALLGALDQAVLEKEAVRYGLDPRGDFIAFRSRSASTLSQRWLTNETLVASVDGDIAGIFKARPTNAVDLAVGVGDAVPLHHLDGSFRQATRCLETAAAFGLAGIFDLDGLGALAAVVSDPELGDRLVRRYLEPLGNGSSAAQLRETLECHLRSGQRVERTATAMCIHQNTVRYRLSRFADLTGVDLRSPECAFELWWALQRLKVAAAQG